MTALFPQLQLSIQPFDVDFKVIWYYKGTGYDPDWFPLKVVLGWANGYVSMMYFCIMQQVAIPQGVHDPPSP